MDTITQYVPEPLSGAHHSSSHQSTSPKWRGVGGWLISGSIHVALIATLASIAYAVREVTQDPVVLHPGFVLPPPKPPEVKKTQW